MHDYKPQFKKAKNQIARKTLLFFGIALIATSIFFNFESELESPEPTTDASPEIKKIALPEKSNSPTLDIQPIEIKTETALDEIPVVTPTVTEAQDETASPESVTDISKETPKVPIPVMSPTWETRTIRSGDSLANIFKEWKLSPSTLHKIVNSSKLAKTLADIHPGETLKLLRDDDDSLLELMVVRSKKFSVTRENIRDISQVKKDFENNLKKVIDGV